uniref:Conserved oligomeric Golgi complex subunit 8 n=1 Tax=Plectus sambesii TaxID=2011161 RepID=A0A914USC1_9BILA
MSFDDWAMKKLFGPNADHKLADPEFSQYLQELSSFSADKLALEPRRLADEKLSLQDETENLAFANYKTFIQAANCSKDIYDDFTLIENHLDTVVSRLPNLSSECRDFLQEAQKVGGRRAADSLALNKHSQLLEILEMPQVMDTCVRAGYWEEALELAQYVTKLQRRLGHIAVIQNVAEEVSAQRQLLLDQLLDQLHTQLNLPQCLKVVGYLRRLNVFTESELRIKFLLARDAWFRSLLAVLPLDDPYQHATKVIELSRVHLFDIVTQYKAVFSDDDPFQVAVLPAGQRETLPTHLPAILHSWMHEKVQRFLEMLQTDLQRGVGGRLDSLLAQTMYFGLSFGRVGADFRSLAAPLFEHAAFSDFSSAVDSATARLLNAMVTNFLPDVHPGSHKAASSAMSTSEGKQDLSPPMTLMDWTPLAVYCNTLLGSFNTIRVCLPLTLAPRVARSLQDSLLTIVTTLATSAHQGFQQLSRDNQAKLRAVCSLLTDDLTLFLNRCLEALFPTKAIATILGVGVGQASELKGSRVDVQSIREPLLGYLPTPTFTQPPSSTKEEIVTSSQPSVSGEQHVVSLNE